MRVGGEGGRRRAVGSKRAREHPANRVARSCLHARGNIYVRVCVRAREPECVYQCDTIEGAGGAGGRAAHGALALAFRPVRAVSRHTSLSRFPVTFLVGCSVMCFVRFVVVGGGL